MHCVELVKYMKDPKEYLPSLINILINFKNHDNFLEKKYQTRMRESVLQTLATFFRKYTI